VRILRVEKGTEVFLGYPAAPLADSIVSSIREIVLGLEPVTEAHLPQCFIPGVPDSPAQVLVVVLSASADATRIPETIGEALDEMLPEGAHLDIWLMESRDALLPAVRNAGCRIL